MPLADTLYGRVPFSPAELIGEARNDGSSYPDPTLRAFIIIFLPRQEVSSVSRSARFA